MTSRRTRVPAIRPGAGTPCSPRAIAAAGSHTAVEMPIGLPVCHHPLMADIGPIAYLLARARWRPVGVELARTDLPVTTSESSRRYRPRAPRRSQMPPHRDRALSRGPALSYHAGVCGDGTPVTPPRPLPRGEVEFDRRFHSCGTDLRTRSAATAEKGWTAFR